METVKRHHVRQLRNDSAYPTVRSIITTCEIILYVLGGATALVSIVTAVNSTNPMLLVAGMVGGIVFAVLAKLTNEMGNMGVDIADSLLEMNMRASMGKVSFEESPSVTAPEPEQEASAVSTPEPETETPLSSIVCPKCGTENAPAVFNINGQGLGKCPSCGNYVEFNIT